MYTAPAYAGAGGTARAADNGVLVAQHLVINVEMSYA